MPGDDVAAGGDHTCVRLNDGTVRCWGDNRYGQLGDGSTAPRLTPVQVTGLDRARVLVAGFDHTCALLDDGTARCWGGNYDGQLGNGRWEQEVVPVAVAQLQGANDLAAGQQHTCATLIDGTAKCWGRNESGQLGNGESFAISSIPQQVSDTPFATDDLYHDGFDNGPPQGLDAPMHGW